MSVIATRVGCALLCLLLWVGCASDEEKMQAHFEKGTAYFEKGEYRAAVIEFRNTIQINPEYLGAYLSLGEAYLQLENFPSAYRQYSTVVRIDPSNISGLIKLAVFELHSKKYDQARVHIDKILALKPDHLDAHYILAALHQADKRFDAADLLYQKIIAIDKQQRSAYLGRSSVAMAQGKLARADIYLDQVGGMGGDGQIQERGITGSTLAFRPQLLKVFEKRVGIYIEQKDYSTALKKCDQQLAYPGRAPEAITAFDHLKGQIYLAQDKRALAEAAFKKAISINASQRRSYQALADIYIDRNKPHKAIDMYRDALQKSPQRIELRLDLGDLYDEQSNPLLAEQQYRRALEIKPDYTPAANNLAYLLANRGANLDEAMKFAKLAEAGHPGNATILDTLGWVYFKQKQYDLAIKQFHISLDKDPDSAITHYHLGLAYDLTNQKMKGIEAFERALALDQYFAGADQARQRIADLQNPSTPDKSPIP